MADEQGPWIDTNPGPKMRTGDKKGFENFHTCCSGSPYSLFLRSLLEYSFDFDFHRDRLFCRPCKRLKVFVGSNIFHKCQQTSKGLSHFPRR